MLPIYKTKLYLLSSYNCNSRFLWIFHMPYKTIIYHHHHHHQHQGLDPLIRSISRVTAVLANISWVFQSIFFLVVCSCMISEGFGFVAFFVCVKASSFCILSQNLQRKHRTDMLPEFDNQRIR
jgi:hypothetical protein